MRYRERKPPALLIAIVVSMAVAGVYVLLTGNGGGGGETAEWEPYQFEEGEHYEYSGIQDSESATLSWDVISVSVDQITVDVSWTLNGENDSLTVTGNKDTVYQQVTSKSPRIGPFMSMTLYGGWIQSLFGVAGLSVGGSWSVTLPDGTYTVEITGTETYAGRGSYVGEARLNDNLVYKAAIAKELGFPTYVAVYNTDSGEKTLEATLQEYSP